MATPPLDEETTKEVLRQVTLHINSLNFIETLRTFLLYLFIYLFIQVEYYFSDSNIPRDNFLRNIIESSEDGSILDLFNINPGFLLVSGLALFVCYVVVGLDIR